MAPIESSASGLALVHHALQRINPALGQEQDLNHTIPYPNRQRILMKVSISLASISVLAAFTAFYWFVRMRRSFRQDLIMLLIQSDMMKAMWLVLCPLVYFSTGSLDNEYNFCQVSGFLLTTAIEATDIAVLMIAVHQALYVLNSHEGGLYPYRRIAYIIWAVVPIILAAIVPISGGQFVANGPNCYLPVHPGWYRQALSWGPRYVIFGLISIIYASVYLYVGLRFRRFGNVQRSASVQSTFSTVRSKDSSGGVPPTPSIMDHGLLDSARHSLSESIGKLADERQDSVVSTASTNLVGDGRIAPQPKVRIKPEAIVWKLTNFAKSDAADTVLPGSDVVDVDPSAAIAHADPVTDISRPPPVVHRSTTQSAAVTQHRDMTYVALTRSLSAPVQSKTMPSRSIWQRTPSSTAPGDSGVIHLSADATGEVMRRSRARTHRQLRLLVVYPIIYVISWIAPFISHALGYDDNVSDQASGPFELQIVSIASFCIGAAVDCCFFMSWEKPWRELRGSFWEGLGSLLGSASRFFRQSERFRPHIQRDARMAQARRAREHLDQGLMAAAMSNAPPRRPREWWDGVDLDNEGGSKSEIHRPVSYHLGASESRLDDAP